MVATPAHIPIRDNTTKVVVAVVLLTFVSTPHRFTPEPLLLAAAVALVRTTVMPVVPVVVYPVSTA